MSEFNPLKVIDTCTDMVGSDVALTMYNKNKFYIFRFEYEDSRCLQYFDYKIAGWEIEKFVNDLDDVLIGAFKFNLRGEG